MTAAAITVTVPGAPRDVTRLYFADGIPFGAPPATPAAPDPAANRHLGWADDMLLSAAEIGARDGDGLAPGPVQAVCQWAIALVDEHHGAEAELAVLRDQVQQLEREATAARAVAAAAELALGVERSKHATTMQMLAGATSDVIALKARLAERDAENAALRHTLAGLANRLHVQRVTRIEMVETATLLPAARAGCPERAVPEGCDTFDDTDDTNDTVRRTL